MDVLSEFAELYEDYKVGDISYESYFEQYMALMELEAERKTNDTE